jgi:hypothetical protein
MERRIPISLLGCLMNWFSASYTCIKWFGYFSQFYRLEQGVRQGAVLSPVIFAICIDDIISQDVFPFNFKFFLFADDVLIVSGSFTCLQAVLSQIETKLMSLDMRINAKKCVCSNWPSF